MQTESMLNGYNVERARRYRRIKLALTGVGFATSIARNGWLALSGRSVRLRARIEHRVPDQRLSTASYLATMQSLSWLAGLPLAYASGYLVERAFDLTRRSSASWMREQVKGAVLGLAINVPLTTTAFFVIRRRPRDWWIVLSGVSVPLVLVATRLGPVLVAPLFNRFETLDDAELTERIRSLGDRAGVRIVDVYRMDMSRQTEKANAFFTGIGDAKRIVLGDTLLREFELDEVEGIVAHELGHQVHGDIWRLLALFGGAGFAIAYALHLTLPPVIRETRPWTGVVDAADVAALPLFGLILTGVGLVSQPFQAAVSRRIERRTDQFALELTENGDAYARVMERLTVQNMDDPDPPGWLVWYAYTHPPTSERIALARAYADRHAGTEAASGPGTSPRLG